MKRASLIVAAALLFTLAACQQAAQPATGFWDTATWDETAWEAPR